MNNQTTTPTTQSDDNKPPAWFEKWSVQVFQPAIKVINENKASLNEHKALLSKIEASLADLQLVVSPFSSDDIFNIPVVGADNHALFDLKAATYTWFNYFATKNTIVGAAHCALPVFTFSSSEPRVFIELPESILKLGVRGVHLYNPYDGAFTNPLPTAKDLVLWKSLVLLPPAKTCNAIAKCPR